MCKRGRILVIDDNPDMLIALEQLFMDEFEVMVAGSGEDGLRCLEKQPDIDAVVLDIRMAKMDGLQTASRIKKTCPDTPIIFNTAHAGDYSKESIDREHQPFDYIPKSEPPQRLVDSVREAVDRRQLLSDRRKLTAYARSRWGIIGRSRRMLEAYKVIVRIAPSDGKVMILGPTGTGKELVARAIHDNSRRADSRIVVFNCSHRDSGLVESELFGHVKGAFTGANRDSPGVFKYADGGTVFLDEIGELDLVTQVKLLRVIEEGVIRRVGSPQPIGVNVRVICATHRNLPELVKQSRFRKDLYFRLGTTAIYLPPLFERREDIPDLIDFFVERYCDNTDNGVKLFDRSARDLLIEYDWPGNIRQLRETVESLINLTPSHLITRADVENLLGYSGNGSSPGKTYQELVRDNKRIIIVRALDHHSWNMSAAARELGLDPANLRKMIKNLDIELM